MVKKLTDGQEEFQTYINFMYYFVLRINVDHIMMNSEGFSN